VVLGYVGVVLLWVTASAAAFGFALPFEGEEEGVEGTRHARLWAAAAGEGGREDKSPKEFAVLGVRGRGELATGETLVCVC
jgi:hypothetical protein